LYDEGDVDDSDDVDKPMSLITTMIRFPEIESMINE
jgi:hypothetical protein